MEELPDSLRRAIWDAVHQVPAAELRTAIRPEDVGHPVLSGLDGLLTSPALLEDFFRRRALASRSPEETEAAERRLRSLAPGELADLVWRRLFLDRQPLSEAARAALTTLGLFGIDASGRDLREIRERFDRTPPGERWEKILRLANLEFVLHRVEPLEAGEAGRPGASPPGFRPLLSLTRIFSGWRESVKKLRRLGFGVKARLDGFTPVEFRRYLAGEADRLKPAALGLDWPPEESLDGRTAGRLAEEAVLPVCREKGLALLLAPSPEGEIFPALWKNHPRVKFLLFPGRPDWLPPGGTAGFRNLLPCGPDWPGSHPAGLAGFLGRRLETLGADFHACHSGAARPPELVGRWAHLRWLLGEALIRRQAELWRTGWRFSEEEAIRDARAVLGGNARAFLGLPDSRSGPPAPF
ncbi:MAG: hypothetical protein LBU64_09705 [Planctomycetota bacterium]|nr:hypothetical protein [Planctomycetota bacterium]